ncbi:MAG: trypsin-like peptidase domain-containing protein [Bacillota bacterium]
MIFKDVLPGDSGYADIEMVSSEGIMVGDPDGYFRPDDYVTRREAAHLEARRLFRYGLLTYVIPRIKKAVMRLQQDSGESGSGFFVSPNGWIATNQHVVGKDLVLDYIDEGMPPGLTARVMYVSGQHDLALCKYDGIVPAYLNISQKDVIDGQHVAVVGQPRGYIDSITQGKVSHLLRAPNPLRDPDCFQLDAAISPGNSGGPVVDAYGNVVGVAVAKYTAIDTEGIGFAIHAEYLREFLMECGVSL